MTEVSFHFNVSGGQRGKLHYACRLLHKAHTQGAHVGVLGEPQTLAALDAALWTFDAHSFIPHCAAAASEPLRRASPIMLASECAALARFDVLLNLAPEVPPGFERFGRLIELVSQEEADRAQARTRWRYYAERGYRIQRHDTAASRRKQQGRQS